MSKEIKQLEMNALEHTFKDVRDLVMMSVQGQSSQNDNRLRLDLRKKKIRMQVVKNTLARRVFGQLGLQMAKCWEGPTTVAWGAGSLSELSRELETAFKNNDKVKFKCAVADGNEVTFAQALKMPTRAEAIGRVVMLALSPAGRIAGQLRGPAGRVAGQVKSISEKQPEGEAAAAS
jgi:large subunit ribosomal protein L10